MSPAGCAIEGWRPLVAAVTAHAPGPDRPRSRRGSPQPRAARGAPARSCRRGRRATGRRTAVGTRVVRGLQLARQRVDRGRAHTRVDPRAEPEEALEAERAGERIEPHEGVAAAACRAPTRSRRRTTSRTAGRAPGSGPRVWCAADDPRNGPWVGRRAAGSRAPGARPGRRAVPRVLFGSFGTPRTPPRGPESPRRTAPACKDLPDRRLAPGNSRRSGNYCRTASATGLSA